MSDLRVTDDMIFGAAVGWEMAHSEMCGRGAFCSAHQPVEAPARRPWLVGRLAAYLAAAEAASTAPPTPGSEPTMPDVSESESAAGEVGL